MDVRIAARPHLLTLLAICATLSIGSAALADPTFSIIDLGTGTPTYGTDSSGNGTVTGSNGLTYTFNPTQNYLPSRWTNTTQDVPILEPAPIYSPNTYGNPNYAYSYSNLTYINNQGLAFGINYYGVDGHEGNSVTFLTRLQANGTWGTPIPLWQGFDTFGGNPLGSGNQILGLSSVGQVLGLGAVNMGPAWALYLYDINTHTLTNMTTLIDSLKWTTDSMLVAENRANWFLSNAVAQLDDQGRILVQATQGYSGDPHNLLLIPDGTSTDPLPAPVPEPAAWAVFAVLIAGGLTHKRLLGRSPRGSVA